MNTATQESTKTSTETAPNNLPANIDRAVPANLMQAFIDATNNPSFNIDKLRQLRELYDEAITDARRRSFNASMAECQMEIGKKKITANKSNKQTVSRYADLAAVNAIIVPIYPKFGFSVTFGMIPCEIAGHYGYRAIVAHTDGFERIYEAFIPIDAGGLRGNENKTATHAFGSTSTYAQRYLLKQIFNLAIDNEDTDGNRAGDKITEAQVKELRAAIAGLPDPFPGDEANFLEFLKVEKLEDLPAKQFQSAKSVIEAERKKRSPSPKQATRR